MRPLASLVLLAAFAAAAPVPKAVKKQADSTQVVGRWIADQQNTHSFHFKDDGTMKVWNGPVENNGGNYRWTLDDTVSPKRMTWYDTTSTPPRPQFECVYELDGDKLTITYESAPNIPKGVGNGNQTHRMTREQAK